MIFLFERYFDTKNYDLFNKNIFFFKEAFFKNVGGPTIFKTKLKIDNDEHEFENEEKAIDYLKNIGIFYDYCVNIIFFCARIDDTDYIIYGDPNEIEGIYKINQRKEKIIKYFYINDINFFNKQNYKYVHQRILNIHEMIPMEISSYVYFQLDDIYSHYHDK